MEEQKDNSKERCGSCNSNDTGCCKDGGAGGSCSDAYAASGCGGGCWRGSRVWLCVLGTLAGVFLLVWSAAKIVEVKNALKYPALGVAEHMVTVSASGKASVSPDTAEIELSVLTEGATPQLVQSQNTRKMNEVVDFVKSSGIDAKDAQTAAYSLYPKYEYTRGQSNIVGYTLTQSLRVKVRDLAKVGVLLEGATQRGANQVGEVRFTLDDPEKFKEAARKEAFEKVRAKAREMSTLAGVTLGRVISFSESGGDIPPPVFYGKSLEGLGGAAGAPPQLEAGTQDVTVSVSVTYLVE